MRFIKYIPDSIIESSHNWLKNGLQTSNLLFNIHFTTELFDIDILNFVFSKY